MDLIHILRVRTQLSSLTVTLLSQSRGTRKKHHALVLMEVRARQRRASQKIRKKRKA